MTPEVLRPGRPDLGRRWRILVTERTNRLAINATENAVLGNNWFFREQSITDQGIDAHVEKFELVEGKKGDDEIGTGRLIALQIKGGKSRFLRPSPNGWWFPFNERKKKLWLGHALPVLVVLVDLEDGELYWQRVSPAAIVKTGKNYKIEVPRSQTVATADAEWVEIASGLELRAVSRFEFSLLSVPPPVRSILEKRDEAERADAALLAMHLAEGRTNPRGTASSLLANSPVWISRNASWAWAAVAAYAADHDVHDLAAEAFLRAAASATDDERKSRALVSAAVLLRRHDAARAQSVLAELESCETPDEVHVAIARTIFTRESNDAAQWDLDVLLTRESDEVKESVAAQRLLAAQARRSGDLDLAVERARAALTLDEDSTESMTQLADSLLARWALRHSATADLNEATSLLHRVIDQRRAWSGPTGEATEQLARAYGLSGQFEALLKFTLPPPHGTAESVEIDRAVGRMAAYAAKSLGRRQAVDAACALLGDAPGDQLIKVGVDVLDLPDEEVADLRMHAFIEATQHREYDEVARLAVTLASEGVDVRDRLTEFVERSVIPEDVASLASALLVAHDDLDEALPALRELAKTDSVAAEHLIGQLRDADRVQEAAEAAATLYEVTGSEGYLIQKADCLIDAGGGPAAIEAAKAAVAHTSIWPIQRGRLLTFLGTEAANAGDWATAERYLTQVLKLFDQPDGSAVWRLVIALVNQGRIKKAAKVVAQYRPEVRTKEEAEVWLRAHATLRWTESIAMDAFALAERFDDPQLSTALLGHIVFSTHGVREAGGSSGEQASTTDGEELEEFDDDELEERRVLAQNMVPGELHRRAFELIGRLVAKYGDRTGVTVVSASDRDELVEKMIDTLKQQSRADAVIADLTNLVRDSRAPIGFLGGTLNRGYATLVLERATGVLVAGSSDNAEHDGEVLAARASFDREVVIDAATAITLTGLRDSSPITGRFVTLLMPPAAMLGLHRASFDVRGLAGSPGSLRWDPEQEGIVMTELSAQEFRRLHHRVEQVQNYADRLQVRTVTVRTHLSALEDEGRHAEWTDVIHLTAEHNLAIWSDDLGLRRLARQLGLVAFGTPAVIDAVRDLALEQSTTPDAVNAAINRAFELQIELAADMVVDLPVGSGGLLRLATADGWKARSGAAVISRPFWWVENPDGIDAVLEIYQKARDEAPGDLATWQAAAMYGVARAFTPEVASGVLALLALLAFGEDDPAEETLMESMRRARQAAADLGHPDPTGAIQAAANYLAKTGKCDDPDELIRRVHHGLDSLQVD